VSEADAAEALALSLAAAGLLSPAAFDLLSLAVFVEAGAVFADVFTGTGVVAPGFDGASLVEGAAAVGVGVTADAASPVRELGCVPFESRAEASRVEEGFLLSFFETSAAGPPEPFSSASGPTRTPSD
jgi:hypothetical protein